MLKVDPIMRAWNHSCYACFTWSMSLPVEVATCSNKKCYSELLKVDNGTSYLSHIMVCIPDRHSDKCGILIKFKIKIKLIL